MYRALAPTPKKAVGINLQNEVMGCGGKLVQEKAPTVPASYYCFCYKVPDRGKQSGSKREPMCVELGFKFLRDFLLPRGEGMHDNHGILTIGVTP